MTTDEAKGLYPNRSQGELSEEQRLDLLAEYMLDRIVAKIEHDRQVDYLKYNQEREMLKI